MFLDNLFGKRKKSDAFDALMDDGDNSNDSFGPSKSSRYETKNDKEQESSSNSGSKSFYDDEDDPFKPKKGGFYGLKDLGEEANRPLEQGDNQIFHFSWWEYAIIIIEFIMLIYVILLFAGVISI